MLAPADSTIASLQKGAAQRAGLLAWVWAAAGGAAVGGAA